MRVFGIASLALACSALLLSGCATPTKLAFAKDATTPPKANEQIFLMTTTLRNSYRTSHQIKLLVVNVEKPDAKDRSDRLNFTIDDGAKTESDSAIVGNSYYLSLKLEPGSYVIEGLTALSPKFPTNTIFFAPLHADLHVTGPGVFYLGHIEATVRERTNNEFKAGPSIPLIDQAVGGASGGTFDIDISDQWETDGARFIAKFPALKTVVVTKAVLPPFDRAKAQEWWEKH
jgi:hypothetical protein